MIMFDTDEFSIKEELNNINESIAEINEEITSYIPGLIGSQIYSYKLGDGVIESIVDGYMHVDFDGVKKLLSYPLPESTTYRVYDETIDLWNKISKLADEIDALKDDAKCLEFELNEIEFLKHQLNNSKENRDIQWDANNVIIKANYNDGGRDRNKCGFCGVCSDKNIEYNIKVKKRSWCSYKDSPCSMYLRHELTREDLEEQMRWGGYICYESRMLRDFTVAAGVKHLKFNVDKAVSICKAGRGKLCVMTTVEPGKKTKDAIVFGMFIIGDVYTGNEDEAGVLASDSRFRLIFTPEEARHFNLWNHFQNRNNPDIKAWGSGLLRYATDEMAVSFLKAAIELKRGTKDENKSIEMYRFFCEENGIKMDL